MRVHHLKYLFSMDMPLIIVAALISMILRIIRPFVEIDVVRWSLGSRLGHLLSEADIYISSKSLGGEHQVEECSRKSMIIDKTENTLLNKNAISWVYIPGKFTVGKQHIPNIYFYSYINKRIKILYLSRLANWVALLNSKLFGEEEREVSFFSTFLDRNLCTVRTPSPFKMRKKDLFFAKKKVEKIGINKDNPLLLFFNRDSSYVKEYMINKNDCENDYRNSSISSYILMAQLFNKLGYSSVRMGAKTEEKLSQEGIFDVSLLERDEKLEFYLFSHARFTVSDCTGLNIMPSLFRKPRVIVNNVPLLNFINDGYFQCVLDSILLFKKHWCEEGKKNLSFSQIKEKNLLWAFDTQDYVQNNIELINNTPEEILDAALEMHQRLNGEWEETEEDILLQHRFWKHVGVKRDTRFLSLYPRVGAKFLRENSWLLE